jgi:hypothetical protein
MQITKQKPTEKFTVSAGFDLYFSPKLETLAIQLGDTEVKLNKDQCQELMNVLNGKCKKLLAFESKEDYQAHSAIFFSCHDKKAGEIVMYTQDSIAKF